MIELYRAAVKCLMENPSLWLSPSMIALILLAVAAIVVLTLIVLEFIRS